ncbi:alpha/beta hydrolase [Pedobacter psychrotolerans]|nr:alpha/beta hydrolase [Pedobacter psychrotolerans]
MEGKESPILFESGGALDATQWDSISTVLNQKLNATIITYDRQGFGLSGLDTVEYNILNEAKGLTFALQKLGYAHQDLLLVSHSLGAFYSTLYASNHPTSVKGMIMLDPRIPSYADMRFAHRIFKTLNRSNFGKNDLGLYYVLAQMEQNSNFMRKKVIPSNIPVLVVMAEKGPFDNKIDNDRFQEAQRQFIKKREKGSLILAKGSSHNIPQDQPELVISEIENFYRRYVLE